MEDKSPRRTLDVVTSSIETPDGVRALEVPKSDAEDETPSKDTRDFSEYSVETIDNDF